MTLTKSNKKKILSPTQQRFIEQVQAIQDNPFKHSDIGIYNRFLIMATLPHKEPTKNKPAWFRKNGKYTLKIQQGWDEKKDKWIGFPYGVIPRLLVSFINQEIMRTKKKRIYLGSLTEFMKKVGLSPKDGRDIRRFKEQLLRLFNSHISFHYEATVGGKEFRSFLNMHIAKAGFLWWDGNRNIENFNLKNSWVEVTQDYYDSVVSHPLLFDARAMKALRRSPLAIDLYMWAIAKVFQMKKLNKKEEFIAWDNFAMQFGAEYTEIKELARKIKRLFTRIKRVYPTLNITFQRSSRNRHGGIRIYESPLAVPYKPKKDKESTQKKATLHVPPDPKYWKHNPALKDLSEDDIPQLSESALRHVIMLMQVYNKDYDIHKIVEDWLFFWNKKGRITLKYPDKAFTAFAKKSFSSDY